MNLRLGSSSYITDNFGRPSHYYEYLPFGELMTEHNQSKYYIDPYPTQNMDSYNNPYKFNGKEMDKETGMYYYGARYYDPRISIFVSVDPLAEQTMEPYLYTGNNPIMFTDPTGMSKEVSGDGGGWLDRLWNKTKSIFKSTPKYEEIPKYSLVMDEFQFSGYLPDRETVSTIQCHHNVNLGDFNPPELSPYTQGSLNVLSGVLGTIGAATYVVATEGVGAAFGGATALTFSIGQITLGVGQIADAYQGGNDKALQFSNSLPGYGARLLNSPYAEYIDARSSLMTTQLGTSGGIKSALQNNVKNIYKGEQVPKNIYELYDTGKATSDLINAKKADE